jgi:hypothetical protein
MMQIGYLMLMNCMSQVYTIEVDWFRKLLMDLPIVEKPLPVVLMDCDNQMVIAKIDNSKDNMKSSRHIKIRLKSVKKIRNSRVITLDYQGAIT